jgi:hypothetical protein
MKQIIRLTESDLHRIVKESVNRIIREWNGDRDINPEDDKLWDEYDNNPYYETDNGKVDRYHKEREDER